MVAVSAGTSLRRCAPNSLVIDSNFAPSAVTRAFLTYWPLVTLRTQPSIVSAPAEMCVSNHVLERTACDAFDRDEPRTPVSRVLSILASAKDPIVQGALRSAADFTRHAGLARTTVSRVLNGQPGLNQK